MISDSEILAFTFHYVSIKSVRHSKGETGCCNLHSTMYLLNPSPTFSPDGDRHNLHSTMYLLNPTEEVKAFNNFLIYIPLCIY